MALSFEAPPESFCVNHGGEEKRKFCWFRSSIQTTWSERNFTFLLISAWIFYFYPSAVAFGRGGGWWSYVTRDFTGWGPLIVLFTTVQVWKVESLLLLPRLEQFRDEWVSISSDFAEEKAELDPLIGFPWDLKVEFGHNNPDNQMKWLD